LLPTSPNSLIQAADQKSASKAKSGEVDAAKEYPIAVGKRKKIYEDGLHTFNRYNNYFSWAVDYEKNILNSHSQAAAGSEAASTLHLKEFKGKIAMEHDRLTKLASTNVEEMDEGNEELTALADGYAENVDNRAQDMNNENTATSGEQRLVMDQGVINMEEKVEVDKEESKNTLASTTEEMKDRYNTLGEKVGERSDLDEERFESEEEWADELKGINKEMTKEIVSTGRENDKEVKRTEKEADGAVPTFVKQEARVEKMAAKTTKGVLKDSLKEVKSVTKDQEDEVEAVEDTADDTADREDDLLKESSKDLQTEANDNKEEARSIISDATSAQMDSTTNLEMINKEASNLEVQSSQLKNDGEATLEKEVDSSHRELGHMENDLESAKATAIQELDAEAASMTDRAGAALEAEVHGSEERVNAEVEKLSNGASGIFHPDGSSLLEGQGNSIQAAISSMNIKAAKLSAETHADDSEIEQLGVELKGIVGSLQEASTHAGVEMAGIEKTTAVETADVTAQIDEKLKEGREALGLEKVEVEKEATAQAEFVNRGMDEKIDGMSTEALAQLSRSSRSIAAATERGKNVMTGLQAIVGDLAEMKGTIDKDIPAARTTIDGALENMTAHLDTSKQKLIDAKANAKQAVTDAEQDMRQEIQKELDASRMRINSQMGGTAVHMEDVIEGLGGTFGDLQKSSIEDYDRSTAFQEGIRQNVERTLKGLSASASAADKNDATYADRLKRADGAIHDGISGGPRDGKVLASTTRDGFRNLFKSSEEHGQKTLSDAYAWGNQNIGQFEGDTSAKLNADLTRVGGYISQNHRELGELYGVSGAVYKEWEAANEETTAMEKEVTDKLAKLRAQENIIIEKMKTATGEERRLLNQQRAEGKTAETELIGRQKATQERKLRELRELQDQKMADERTRMQMLSDRMLTQSQKVNGVLTSGEAGVAGSLAMTREQLAHLEESERYLAGTLGGETGSLHDALTLEEQAVRDRQKTEQAAMEQAMDADLGQLQNLLGSLSSAKGKSSAELEALREDFNRQMAALKGLGPMEAAEMKKAIESLMASNPNYAKLFADDTMEPDKELDASHERLTVATQWTKKVVDGFYKKLGLLSKERVSEANSLHSNSDSLKRFAVTETEHTIDTLKHMVDQSQKVKVDMEGQLEGFEHQLTDLSGTTVDHDTAKITKLDDELYNVMAAHSRLKEWHDQFKHMSTHWRAEVEDQLRKIGRGISNGDSELENSRLDQEISMNEGLRKMQLRVEDKVAESDGERTAQFGTLADQMGAKIAGALDAEATSSENAMSEEQAAKANMNGFAKTGAALREDMSAKAGNLELEAGKLGEETKVAANSLGNLFTLPKLTNSPANQQIDKKFELMHAKLARMQMSMSLLQEHNIRTTHDQATSLAQISSTGKVSDKAYQSVKGLIAEMKKRNQHLKEENKVLAKGVERVKANAS